ncbi:MAG: protein kinase [bacterium]|nr:protein kinase [bacterium]
MAKILVVDDDPDILLTLRIAFEGAHHEVIATHDPDEVLLLAATKAPDAITLDVMMPEVSGWDLIERIRNHPRTQSIPVLMLTALGEVPNRVRGLRTGADDYLVKPFDPEELLARVERLIARNQRPLRDSGPGSHDRTAPEPGAAERTNGNGPDLEAAIAELSRRVRIEEELGDIFLGRYQVVDLIGSGAMGMVFRGWDPKLKRPVALKTISFDAVHIDREAQVSNLLEEAVTSARFNHPNIVTVYDVGDQGAAAFIAMEWVDGASLDAFLRDDQRIPHDQVIPLAAAIARALGAAHENEFIHRDVKPGNVLLGGDGSIKVSDFGIAEWISRAANSGEVFGTPGYLAPECLMGEGGSIRSDLFALGVLLYECLTGQHPFIVPNWAKTLHNTVVVQPEPIEQVVPQVPQRAGEMVNQLLEKDVGKRPSSAAVVAQVFEVLAGEGDLKWTLRPPGARRVSRDFRPTRTRLIPIVPRTGEDSAA